MSTKYSVEDLLKLRASPLIRKPANLPAIEDILSSPDAVTKRPNTRGKPEDTTAHTESFPKRPLLDAQHRKSTTDPDRIVLGPPRRSFASSNARATGKASEDSPDDNPVSIRGNGADKLKNGEVTEVGDLDQKNHQTNGRPARNDQDLTEGKTRRKFDEDDDTKSRRDPERKPKWVAGDDEQRTRNKFEQPWFRHDRSGDSLDDTKRDGNKQSDWRRDRGRDRPWDRPVPAEEDPEWMDEPAEGQATPVRTQEDFQRWKEKMKAGKSATVNTEEVVLSPSSPEPPSGKSQKASKVFADIEPDDSMDKFFARFNEAKITTEPTAVTKAPTKTRFASLFSPAVEQPPQLPQPSQTPIQAPETFMREITSQTPVESPNPDADQAGFARILEMLQGRSQHTPASQPSETNARVPLYARDGQSKSESDKAPPPGLMGLLAQSRPPIENQPRQSHERPQESRSPPEKGHGRQQSNKDTLLLNLLKQANQAPKPTPASHLHDQYATQGIFSADDGLNRSAVARNQMISPHQPLSASYVPRGEPGRGMSEPPQQGPMRYYEEPGHEHLVRRQTNETPRAGYDNEFLNLLRSQGVGQQQMSNPANQQSLQGPPPGLGRPPGLDQMSRPPPGWPTQQPQSQTQPQRQSVPPPGMPNMPRNIPPQYTAANLPPQSSQRPQQLPPPQQRKYTGESGMPGFPPMGPPPGFMNNGPPPGFPGVGQSYGRYPGPPEPPQGVGRAFMDMYGDAGRPGLRGNVGGGAGGGMPGYR